MNHVRNNFVLALLAFAPIIAMLTVFTALTGHLPEGTLACADGQGFFNGDYLVLNASEGSNAFIAYDQNGNIVKVHAMPWQVSPNHDLWVEDCVREIKEAAAQQ